MLKPHEVMANDHGAAPSRSIAGVYECHEAALLSQDDVSIDATGWRHVTVEPCGGRRRYGSEFRWTTRSGKQWTLSPMHEDGVYAVGHTCPFFVDGHTRCEVERDGEDNVVALIGPVRHAVRARLRARREPAAEEAEGEEGRKRGPAITF